MGIHEKNFNFKKSLLTNLFFFSGKTCEALDIKYIDSEVKSCVRLILDREQNPADYGSSGSKANRKAVSSCSVAVSSCSVAARSCV